MVGYKCSKVHVHWKFCRSKVLGSGKTFHSACCSRRLVWDKALGEVMATKEGTGSSSRNGSAAQSTGAKPYLPEGCQQDSAPPAHPESSHRCCLSCSVLSPSGVSHAGWASAWEHRGPQKQVTNATLPVSAALRPGHVCAGE